MLNQSRVLHYIKDNLAFPFQHLELEDDKIVEHFTTYSLREFSTYVPDIERVGVTVADANKVPNRQNEYYITDPENLEILNVIEIYFGGSDFYIHGHPYFGPMSHFEMREWALATEMANQTKSFSTYDKTFEFMHPNIVRISPVPSNFSYFTAEYERVHPATLRRVPNEFQVMFCEFAMADIQILLGRIRKKYGDGNMRTPFGEIPIGTEIYDEGKEKKRELLEEMKRLELPNVVLDHG